MYDRMVFDTTPYGTIRVWMYFQEELFSKLIEHPVYGFFEFVNCWGGPDKRERGMISWELPASIGMFIVSKFGHRQDCELHIA